MKQNLSETVDFFTLGKQNSFYPNSLFIITRTDILRLSNIYPRAKYMKQCYKGWWRPAMSVLVDFIDFYQLALKLIIVERPAGG